MSRLKYPIISLIVFLLVWQICSSLNVISPIFFPSPLEVIKELILGLFKGEIIKDILATLIRMAIGLSLAILIGVPIGLLMGYSKKIYDWLETTIDFLRSIPPPTLFPLFMLFFGIGNLSKIFPVVFACSFYILISTMYGVRNVKKKRIISAKIHNINKFDLFRKIIIPESLPYIFSGLRMAISLSLILVIVFEMFVGTKLGLGQRIIEAQIIYNIAEMYSAIIIAGIIGYLLNKSFVFCEKKIIHWEGKF